LNGNKLKDIILGFSDRLTYYLQNKSEAIFADEPSGEFRLDFLSTLSTEGKNNLLLYSHQFADLNADGVMDIVIALTIGDSSDIGNLVTRFFIFIANPQEKSVGKIDLYQTVPSHIINLKGICPLWRIVEINGDAFADIFITSFKLTLGANIKKTVLKYIPITYQIYLNKGGKKFSPSPEYERSINFPLSAVGKGTGLFSHIYLGYDFNLDTRTDLLTISGPEKKKGVLAIYLGRPKEKLMHPDGISFEKDEFLLYPVRIPDKVIVLDLNNDKKNDIILQYKSRLITLISK
jgi:hypothetical protein